MGDHNQRRGRCGAARFVAARRHRDARESVDAAAGRLDKICRQSQSAVISRVARRGRSRQTVAAGRHSEQTGVNPLTDMEEPDRSVG